MQSLLSLISNLLGSILNRLHGYIVASNLDIWKKKLRITITMKFKEVRKPSELIRVKSINSFLELERFLSAIKY